MKVIIVMLILGTELVKSKYSENATGISESIINYKSHNYTNKY